MAKNKILLGLFLAVTFYHAASYCSIISPPEKEVYYSSDKKLAFEVIPRDNDKNIPCQGTLFKHINGIRVVVWHRVLPNPIAPAYAIVSDTGKYVITFNDWDRHGYEHSIVVFGNDSKLLYQFSLEDILTEEEFSKVKIDYLGQRYWSQGKGIINEAKDILIVDTVASQKQICLKEGKLLNDQGVPIKLPKIEAQVEIDLSALDRAEQRRFYFSIFPMLVLDSKYRSRVSQLCYHEGDKKTIILETIFRSKKQFMGFCYDLEIFFKTIKDGRLIQYKHNFKDEK